MSTKAKTAEKPIDAAVAVGKEAIEQVVKTSAEVANKGYEKAVAMTKENVEAYVKAGSAAFKGYEDVLSFGKENLDAWVRSGTILAKGWQETSKVVMGLTQEVLEEGMAASKAMMTVKSVKELVDLQSSLVKTGFDKVVAEAGRISEVNFKLAEQAVEPINERVTIAMAKIMTPIAA